MTEASTAASDEAAIRALIARWAKAVRAQDLAGTRSDHDPDVLMFDVPPPFPLARARPIRHP